MSEVIYSLEVKYFISSNAVIIQQNDSAIHKVGSSISPTRR